MSPLKKRFIFISFSLLSGAIGLYLILWVFQEKVLYFYTPSELIQKMPSVKKAIRLGGIVERGSIQKKYSKGKQEITFIVTDGDKKGRVIYEGTPPDLFREGQGVVIEGKIMGYQEGLVSIEATSLLAKHDETYMPPEVASALKEKGYWKDTPR